MSGLGYMLFVARDFYRTEVIVLGMIVIGVLWLLLDRLLLAPLERARSSAGAWCSAHDAIAQDLERLCAPHRALALDRLDRAVHSAVRRVVDRHRAGNLSACIPARSGRGVAVVRRAHLEGHPAGVSAGQHRAPRGRRAWGIALGIPLGIVIGMSSRAHAALWPLLLFFQAIGDIAWLPILVIWFGYGLVTMTAVIVYTVIFPVVLNTVLGVRSIPVNMHSRGAEPRRSRARSPVGGRAARRAAQHRRPACATGSATAGAR
jgi:hypothetical protein